MELLWLLLIGAAGLGVGAWLRARAHATRIDPVCGMTVQEDTPYFTEHQGRHYRFCTRSCLNKFKADPAAWLNRSASPRD